VNPALPAGTLGDVSASAADTWQVTGRLSYAGITYSKLQQGTRQAPNPDNLRVHVHLATTELRVTAPTSTVFSVQLPLGRLSTSTDQDSTTDTDLGDAEIRLRHSLPWLKKPRIEVGGGLVLPTGPYVAKSGAVNLPPEASFLTLGRGVTWGVVEAQVTLPLSKSLSTYAQFSARSPFSRTEDDFEWGDEARAVIGGQRQLPYGLAALAIAELQWRGRASEPDPFNGQRIESANAGGTWWTLTPALSYRASEVFSILGGLRVPLRSNVHGNQLVPGVGGFVALSSSWSKKSDKPSPKKIDVATIAFVPPKPVLGSITIVDYWATWCAPCKEIDAALKKAEPGWSGVEIIRVDATGWPDNGVVLPGETKGLPVLEIFDAKGVRSHLLTGKDALKVVEIVDTLVASPAP
jgi:thiol-disulfide isomerase/thioredoxin